MTGFIVLEFGGITATVWAVYGAARLIAHLKTRRLRRAERRRGEALDFARWDREMSKP